MGQLGQLIASSASLTPLYAERLLNGVTPDRFARFAAPGGVIVKSNHPAFVFGHLALYPARVLERLGKPAGVAAYPQNYDALFKNGVDCVDDPQGRIYPPMAELTKFFFDAHKHALAAVADADDALLLGANPAEGRMRELFPTLGAMLGFYLNGHAQQHLGQMSAWRRMMGLPPA